MKQLWMKLGIFMIFFFAGFMAGGGYRIWVNPKISVIMSTYNRAKLLPRSIESILNQTYGDFEFIIINDGSTDDTGEILKEYARKDDRVKIITNPMNRGLIYSLDKGLNAARGQYIARMDDDDISLPDRFKRQIHYMENHPKITVLGTRAYVEKEGGFIKSWGYEEADKNKILMFFEVPVFHPSVMMRASFLKNHHIRYQSKYLSAEDTYLWYQIAMAGGRITNLKEPLMIRVANSPKKKGYFTQQGLSFQAYLRQHLSDYMDASKLIFPLPIEQSCYILHHLKKAVLGGRLDLNLQALDDLYIDRKCTDKDLNPDYRRWH